jgi:small subunit ribosomal protein S16
MGLKIRLRKQGRTNRPFYRLVVMETRTKRDGKYIEALGWYNPVDTSDKENFSLKADRIDYWLDLGVEISEKAEALVKRGAPEIVRKYAEKALAHKAKMASKRKARKNGAAAV